MPIFLPALLGQLYLSDDRLRIPPVASATQLAIECLLKPLNPPVTEDDQPATPFNQHLSSMVSVR